MYIHIYLTHTQFWMRISSVLADNIQFKVPFEVSIGQSAYKTLETLSFVAAVLLSQRKANDGDTCQP